MTVAAILPATGISGPARQLIASAVPLAALGIELKLVVLERKPIGRELRELLTSSGITYAVLPDRRPFDLGLLARARRHFAEMKPDIVQTHGYKASALAFGLRLGKPAWRWIGFFHGTTAESRRARIYHAIDRRLLTRATLVVAMSEQQREWLSRAGCHVTCVYNAVLPSGTSTATGDRFAGLGGVPRPLLGTVGRLSHEKGIDLLIDSVGRLARSGLRFTTVVAGDGPERPRLESECQRLGIADRVRFLGNVSGIEDLFATLDLLVIPSRSEGLPNVLLEALRADLPVVATRVGAVADVLEPHDAGVLVNPHAESLTDGIRRALNEDRSLRQKGRHAAVDAFSLEQRARALAAVYSAVVDNGAREHDRAENSGRPPAGVR